MGFGRDSSDILESDDRGQSKIDPVVYWVIGITVVVINVRMVLGQWLIYTCFQKGVMNIS